MTLPRGITAFYSDWATQGAENPRSAISSHFEASFAAGGRVLDVGCGKGRDLVALLDMGFDAYGLEPHPAMRAQALARDARVPGRVGEAALPHLGRPFGGAFDGVVCSAVLMHVPPPALPPALAAIAALLVPGGRLLMALPEMRTDLLRHGIAPDGREFANHSPAQVQALLAVDGTVLRASREMGTGSADTLWRVLLFESSAGDGTVASQR